MAGAAWGFTSLFAVLAVTATAYWWRSVSGPTFRVRDEAKESAILATVFAGVIGSIAVGCHVQLAVNGICQSAGEGGE